MKKIFGILMLSTIAYCASAQDSSSSMTQDTSMSKMQDMKKNCVMMKDGKVMLLRNGDKKVLDSVISLNNGATISPDGSIKLADGTTKMIKEGQYIDMDGKMGMMKKDWKKDKI